MTLHFLLVFLGGLSCLAVANAINTPVNRRSDTNPLQLLPDVVNTSLTVAEPSCLPRTRVDPQSCRNAIGKIPRTARYITLGFRGTGSFDLTLPYIWTSDDGTCSIYVAPIPPFEPDVYNFLGLSEDAEQIQQKCVENPLMQSGTIEPVGELKRLAVQISGSSVHVDCDDDPAPPYNSCRSVLDTMPYIYGDRTFGPGGQYPLPFSVPSIDGQCVFQITSSGAATKALWAEIFRAIAQVDEICVKNGKSGHAYNVGVPPYLNVSIAQGHEVAVS